MSRLPMILAFCLTTPVLAVPLGAQRGTDFSGRWVLDETQVPPAPDIPQRLVVEQPLSTTNVFGAPMPPAYLTLNVTRFLGDVIQQDEYRIGVIGGTTSGLVNGRPSGDGGSRFEVTWRGDTQGDFLWIYRETYADSGVNIKRRGETWRIDDSGRLVISIETREKNEAAITRTLTYRRDR